MIQALNGSKSELGGTIGPWMMNGFKRPNEFMGVMDVVTPMVLTPWMFYMFGVVPW